MSLIRWKTVYETGIVALDDEHRELVAQINRLNEMIRQKQGGALSEIFAVLANYTENHFQHEERLMEQYGFPGLVEHQAVHQELRDRVEEMQSRTDLTDAELAKELYRFLRAWLLEHIVEVDKKYGVYLESRAGRFIS